MMKKLLMLAAIAACVLFNTAYAGTIENNKEVAVKFFDAVVNQKNFAEASKYLGPTFIEHNSHAEDGKTGLKHLIEFFKKNYPQARGEVIRVIAEGNYVFLHVHEILTPDTRGTAVAEIFRLNNGKVIEHWDVSQDIPEKSENPNGMF